MPKIEKKALCYEIHKLLYTLEYHLHHRSLEDCLVWGTCAGGKHQLLAIVVSRMARVIEVPKQGNE